MSGRLASLCQQAFSPSGALSQSSQRFGRRYQVRAGQQRMVQAVADAMERRTSVVVEAGTGVGKTFAYLVPAVLSGARVLVSTATKNLQDQLYTRDLPAVLEALGVPAKTALLKGRANYLCLHRLDAALHGSPSSDRRMAQTLAQIERWAQQTQSGDLAELEDLDERSQVLPLVTSTRENCLGAQCPKAKECHVSLARKEALAADIIVVNHHLFFADMAVRESGVAQILPSAEVVIFDEAHQINEIGVGFLAKQVSTSQLLDFARDMEASGLQLARGLVDWATVVSALEYAVKDLRLVAGKKSYAARLPWTGPAPAGVDAEVWEEALHRILEALVQVQAALKIVLELAPEFVRLAERAQELVDTVQLFLQKASHDTVRWLEVGAQLQLIESPLDIAGAMREQWFPEVKAQSPAQAPAAGAVGAQHLEAQVASLREGADAAAASGPTTASLRSWIFTSATLGSDAQLSWFLEGCGLCNLAPELLEVLRVESPFDYQMQSALYVPVNFPKPSEPEHLNAVAQLALQAVQGLQGRTLVLTTTLRALSQIGAVLAPALADSGIEVLVQGQHSKRELIERFRHPKQAAVLVASSSFWEGVDIAGDALQCVVIDKLPFPPPSDPLVEARCKRFEAQGRSSFNDYFLPEAAISLKQGTGRLIRSEEDVGVLVVCDPRLMQMGYGKKLIAALPAMPIVRTREAWEQWLALLRRRTLS